LVHRIAIIVSAVLFFGCAPLPVKKEEPPPPCEICLAIKRQLAKPAPTYQMPKTLAKFYSERSYQPAWIESDALPPRVKDLVLALGHSDLEGLDPRDYHLDEIEKIQESLINNDGKIADAGRSAALDLLLSDAYLFYASHLLGGRTDPGQAHAQWSLIRKKTDLLAEFDKVLASNGIASSLKGMAPQHAGYEALRNQLALYRRKYAAEKKPDGKEVYSAPVIVGKNDKDHRTPVFSNRISYLEFSPSWNVPKDIAVKEMLGHIQEDPAYLTKNHLEVVAYINHQPTVVDPKKFDWCDYTPHYFPFLLRQKPGPWNSLGGIKFMFPNEYNVYIHAHPEKNLFKKRRRMPLAQFVLKDPDWTAERVISLTKQPEPIVVDLQEPLPVYLVYWTAWIDKWGKIHFAEDAYGLETESQP
jgi:murein L,D-transpeptidase YcbB/YkuD